MRRAVHPRACGERTRSPTPTAADTGSSPRVRGTVKRSLKRSPYRRFIPARAGNGSTRPSFLYKPPVHPRACGERPVDGLFPPIAIGSSPRVRGTASDGGRGRRLHRFIPARAGNGYLRRDARPVAPVHPRACGERHIISRIYWIDFGSSPRVRGTAWGSYRTPRSGRFIPARAGNGDLLRFDTASPSVHPRACGER